VINPPNPSDSDAQSQRELIVGKMGYVGHRGEQIHICHSVNCRYKVEQMSVIENGAVVGRFRVIYTPTEKLKECYR